MAARKNFSSAWAEIEDVICESLPSCVKIMLSESGYDSLLGINLLNESSMFEVEDFVNANRDITLKLECCFADSYKNLKKFRFLPAHRLLILRLPHYVNEIFGPNIAASAKINRQQHEIIDEGHRKDANGYSFLLKKLIESTEKNAVAAKNRYRYDETIHLFSTYIFLCSGRSCYEVLSSNLPIPSKHTVCKFHIVFLCLLTFLTTLNLNLVANIRDNQRRIIEGELRCEQLRKYLENLNAEKAVWISEDGSGIVSNVHYDSIFDQLVGYVLPFGQNTGSPIPFSFNARDADQIIEHMSNPNIQRSCLVYLVMAQPLSGRTPPFVLQIFGSDNRFPKEDVVKRWEYTRDELAK